MTDIAPAGYRAPQIIVHWVVFALVAFQFFTGDNMTHLFRAAHGGNPTDANWIWTPIHILVGAVIVLAMLRRLMMRRAWGAPPPPAGENAALRFLAGAVHWLLYADLIAAGITGVVAYLWLPTLGPAHEFLTRLPLMILVGLHALGALWHHFYLRDDVMRRMVRPIRG